ncbi:MAG: M56 family metallopeptidase [Pedobacter sp.]|uniref:M56 family metallopeptidase n=1 Tax=Pedobacter sp. TaxID=1411316 RepID=UPI0028087498|nr:M56 family metallopeptidase [Pedobacter sp.]MDQ8003301.1 M56 family metallopeptidase [Pedobacter sp.]
MNWLYYLLEANLYLATFYVMYKLLLQRSTFYNSNRYFLLSSIVAAFAIPVIQLGFLKPTILLETEAIPYEIPLEPFEIATVAKAPVLSTQDYIFYGYLVLALFIGLKFIVSISKIIKIYLRSNKRKLNNYTLVELTSEHTAFSFFNILFIHPEMAKNNAVLKHEIIHIKQKHSWDIVLLELLKICCWFNPVVYLMKTDLTLLHEYIADEKTTVANISKHEYAMFLIENSMAAYSSSLVNQLFNQSILKSRINMLNKEKTANWARLKYLLAVPLGVGLLCASTLGFSKSYGYFEIGEQKLVQQKSRKVLDETDLAKKGFYSPSYIFDENDNYKSLEKRLIVINGVAVKDNNKFYGANNAENILFLNPEKGFGKYGAKAKHGAVEVYGKKLVMTAPYVIADTAKFPAPKMQASGTPPLSPKPPRIEEPPKGKKLKKFPPPIVKPDEKATKANKAKLKKEIELAEISLKSKEKLQEIEVVPTKQYEGVEIKDGAATSKAEELKIVPAKKPRNIRLTPTATQNKTGALKKGKQRITPAKDAFQKTNNVFNKAWTLYKPKAEENKDDNC